MRRIALTVLSLSTLGLLGATSPANASTADFSCTNGSFKGLVRMYYTGTTTKNVTALDYQITPVDLGRNSNNVGFSDGGVMPTLTHSISNGVRDGQLHTFWSVNYSRGLGGVGVSFDFDRFGTDPHCSSSRSF